VGDGEGVLGEGEADTLDDGEGDGDARRCGVALVAGEGDGGGRGRGLMTSGGSLTGALKNCTAIVAVAARMYAAQIFNPQV
jgi:hypothetical protein